MELTAYQYDIIYSVIKWMMMDIILLFPKYSINEHKNLFQRILENNLTRQETSLITAKENKNASAALQSKNHLVQLLQGAKKMNADFECTPQMIQYVVTTCMEKVFGDEDLDIEAEITKNMAPKEVQKSDIMTFEQFKIAYQQAYNAQFFKNPFSAMKRMLANGTINSIEQVRTYAESHPGTRTAKIIERLNFEFKQEGSTVSIGSSKM